MKSALTLCCLCLLIACQSPDPRLRPTHAPAPAAQPPSTRFERLPPERTGISFVPTIAEEFRYNFIADPYIYNGGGVAVLDVNRDGLQDLFFSARLQPCRLYLNQGNFRFADVSESSGVSKFIGLKTGVNVVDINADGWPDLYVCRTWLEAIPERRNLLLVNGGATGGGTWSGTFSEQAAAYGLDDISASQHANFFDYDLDGDLDAYLLNHPTDFKNINTLDYNAGPARQQPPRGPYESDRLMRNDGPGKPWTDVTAAAGLSNRAFGLSTLVSDFDDDGRPDLFVGNDFVMPDFLYLNSPQGKFRDAGDEWLAHTSNHTMGVDYADLNRDGHADLVALDMLAEAWPRRHQLMSTMQRPRDRQMRQLGYGRQAMRNVLQLGPLSAAADIGWLAGMAATDWSWAPLIADFDNDGWRDLFLSSGVQRDLNDLDFFLYTADSINRTGGVSKARFPDFQQYVNLLPSVPSHNYLYQNTGTLAFSEVSEAWGLRQPGFSNGAAYADLDNDGDLDLITNNLGSPPGIYENKAAGLNGQHWLQIKCQGSAFNPVGQGAKVRVWAGGQLVFSQEMTPVRGFYSSVEPIWQVGLGSSASAERIEIDWQEGKHQILTQVPADQRLVLDIAQAAPGRCPRQPSVQPQFFEEKSGSAIPDFTHRENDFEDFDREKLLPYRLSRSGPPLATGDLNADGREDVLIGGAAGQAAAVFLQTPEGGFSPLPQPALAADREHEDTALALFDADGDGDLDAYVVSGGNEQPAAAAYYQDRLYLNEGRGLLTRAAQSLPTETAAGSCVQAADLDGDGLPEIVVGGRAVPGRFPEAERSFVLKRGSGGAYTDVTAALCPDLARVGMVTDVKAGDLNGDGQPELVVLGDWMGLKVFQREGKGYVDRSAAWGLEASAGWWNCLTLADLDGDGDLDLAAGNEGLNHRLRASATAPMRLFAQDFDRSGSLDPLLCIADGELYRPLPQRDALAAQLPMVKKKFPRYAPYAAAAVTDIFPEKDLLGGLCLSAQTFESQWFENQQGRLVPHPLPLEAQVAPVQDVVAADFNADGKTDLLALGNEYGSEIETYQQDASRGCLLLSDGQGGFSAMPHWQSGLLTRGDTRRAALLRGPSGQRLLLVSNNNGRLQGFRVKR